MLLLNVNELFNYTYVYIYFYMYLFVYLFTRNDMIASFFMDEWMQFKRRDPVHHSSLYVESKFKSIFLQNP